MKALFFKFYNSQNEQELHEVVESDKLLQNQENWHPLGDMENNYSVVENQQSSPIAALVEKLTNSIDAMLMKKSYENSIDPKGNEAPQSMDQRLAGHDPRHAPGHLGMGLGDEFVAYQ